MTVTDIVELNQSKVKVYMDYEFAFVLYKGEIRKYQIQKGQELSEDVYATLCGEVLPKRAKLRAMNLLTKRPYTEEKLRQKLREGYYTEEYIDMALEYVKSFGYINDENYVRDYVTYHMQGLSRKQMEQKLQRKGISKEVIARVIEEEMEEQDVFYEQEQISELFQKRYKGIVPCDKNEYGKMMQFFIRRGYGISDIRKVLGDGRPLDDLYND